MHNTYALEVKKRGSEKLDNIKQVFVAVVIIIPVAGEMCCIPEIISQT